MKLRRFLAIAVVLALPKAAGAETAGDQPSDEETGLRLKSVLVRRSDVFASNAAGIFRSTTPSHRWTRIAMPAWMPEGGQFAKQPPDSGLVIYSANGHYATPAERRRLRFGLYLSRDDGRSWDLFAPGDQYGKVVLLVNGRLFVQTNPYEEPELGPVSVLLSPDLGKTWRDITPRGFGAAIDISPDPDHPDLVALRTNNHLRSFVLRAEDERYLWSGEIGRILYSKAHPESAFFNESFIGNRYFYATLRDYHFYGCDGRTILPIFQIVHEKRYAFDRDDRHVIKVCVRYRAPTPPWPKGIDVSAPGLDTAPMLPRPVCLVDLSGTSEFWGVRVEHMGSRHETPAPLWSAMKSSNRRAERASKVRSREDFVSPDMSQCFYYQRPLDLDSLIDLSAPGVYKLQLVYDDSGIAHPKEGEWSGTIIGPVFEVTIQ